MQQLANTFWKHWLKLYLPSLMERHKWHQPKRNIAKGDLVLVCTENTPQGLWPMGLVIDVQESPDGLVRSAKMKTRCTVILDQLQNWYCLKVLSKSNFTFFGLSICVSYTYV